MTLIASISGIRGTLGGKPGTGLTPPDIVGFVTAYVRMLRERFPEGSLKIVVGRDGRKSGPAVNKLVCGTIQLCGADVVDLGLSTTPSVEHAVLWHGANGGVIITASHNGAEWNALKLLNHLGEFISDDEGVTLLKYAERGDFTFSSADQMGVYITDYQSIERHVETVLHHPLVNIEAIRNAQFKVAFDGINSTGGIALPLLLKELGVQEVFPLNHTPDGNFAHNPEPLPEHLTDICTLIKKTGADVGFVVDPDVDRLAVVSEDGTLFGEEYTLVAVADYVLSVDEGNTVSNLSSSRALRDLTIKYGREHFAAAVGEVNVVKKMKEVYAVIGGEGNGGVILPSLHYGRDALAGVALFLTALAVKQITCSMWRKTLPQYQIRKKKLEVDIRGNIQQLFEYLVAEYPDAEVSRVDGLKLDFPDGWIHLRKSNTEPVVRIYSEAATAYRADDLANSIIAKIETYATI
jgi:phosphomannomutase